MKTRPYRMRQRAESVAATGEQILDAAEALFWQEPSREATLNEIATRAGVSVQTVIRRFATRDRVEAAAHERALTRVRAQRDEAVPGDVAGAVRVLIAHYEHVGDRVLRMLAGEHRRPALAEIVGDGRKMHVAWCERVFASVLSSRHQAAHARRLAQIVAVCDVYTWKILRRDNGLSRSQTELALRELLEPLIKET